MDNEKVRVGLIEDLRGYGKRVPLSTPYDEAIGQWQGLFRKDPAFRHYVARTPSPMGKAPRRPTLKM